MVEGGGRYGGRWGKMGEGGEWDYRGLDVVFSIDQIQIIITPCSCILIVVVS
jgi:hypothetical protein